MNNFFIKILYSFAAILVAASFNMYQNNSNEYELKSAFIYSFTKYLELNNPNQTFVVGVLGNSPIVEALENQSINKKIENKKVEVIKFLNVGEVKDCQIIFVPQFVPLSTIKELLEIESSKNILIITEKKGALEIGSGINFLMIDNKIKFEINQQTLIKNNIKASSQLLKLAVNNKN